MNHIRRTYVEFVYPCCSVDKYSNKYSVEEVKSRDASKVRVPEDAFGFSFFDVLVAKVECDGKTVELRSDRLNQSSMYYYGGLIFTRAEVPQKLHYLYVPTLLFDMDKNGWDRVIRTSRGNFQPFRKSDVLIETTA